MYVFTYMLVFSEHSPLCTVSTYVRHTYHFSEHVWPLSSFAGSTSVSHVKFKETPGASGHVASVRVRHTSLPILIYCITVSITHLGFTYAILYCETAYSMSILCVVNSMILSRLFIIKYQNIKIIHSHTSTVDYLIIIITMNQYYTL